ncbi:transglycosylase [Clostridium botulinum]|uniref:transglycosylase n=1 Tax=Clostridium botulinum TaxID=1491 RepID=UPI000C75D8F6|nr:transglycosylase [Clostridium botulinum]AUM89178.1 transglycosylase [Clostridium botulinum]
MEIYCDKCGKDFEMNIKVKKHHGGVEETYFKCPHCKEKHTSFFTDKSIRIKQTKVRNKTFQLNKCRDMGTRIEILKELDNMKQALKVDMDNLKKKMLGTQ